MILGFHVIFSAYGFWLPNDPRGSWSQFVASWDLLLAGGPATKIDTTKSVAAASHDQQKRRAAKKSLHYPPVAFTGRQAQSVAKGFKQASAEAGIPIYAASILPRHVHLVLGRLNDNVSSVSARLKSRATKQLNADGLNPFQETDDPRHTPWTAKYWKVFIDANEHMAAAIEYVERNPIKEGKRRQVWSFVRRYDGERK